MNKQELLQQNDNKIYENKVRAITGQVMHDHLEDVITNLSLNAIVSNSQPDVQQYDDGQFWLNNTTNSLFVLIAGDWVQLAYRITVNINKNNIHTNKTNISNNTTKLGTIESGTYTPTISNETSNITASTIKECHYSKNGNIVTYSGSVVITINNNNLVKFNLSIPFNSGFTNNHNCSGTCSTNGSSGLAGFVRGDATNDNIQIAIRGLSANTATTIFFTSQYVIK